MQVLMMEPIEASDHAMGSLWAMSQPCRIRIDGEWRDVYLPRQEMGLTSYTSLVFLPKMIRYTTTNLFLGSSCPSLVGALVMPCSHAPPGTEVAFDLGSLVTAPHLQIVKGVLP